MQALEIRNFSFLGTDNFTWQAVSNVPWLKLSQSSGVANVIGSKVNLSVDTSTLQPGIHLAKVTISSTESILGSPQTIPVLVSLFSKQAPTCFPNRKTTLVNTTAIQLDINVDASTIDSSLGCDVTGTVSLRLPANNTTLDFRAKINANNGIRGSVSGTFKLGIAKMQLILSEMKLDNDGVSARGLLDLSALGTDNVDFGTVRIDHSGLTINGSYSFPLAKTLNLQGFSLSTTQATIRVATTTNNYEVDIDGSVQLNIPGSPLDLKLTVTINQDGIKVKNGESIALPSFDAKLAGLTLAVSGAKFGNLVPGQPPFVFAEKATLKLPSGWGGKTSEVYNIQISVNGDVSIGGGRFRLPEIKAGGFTIMQLEGGLVRVGNGFEISAGGVFQLIAGPAGLCELRVNTTLYAGPGAASVLEIDSENAGGVQQSSLMVNNAPDATEGLALRELGLGLWNCFPGIPIGYSGLFFTGVQGTVVLRADIQSVSVRIQVQTSLAQVAGIAALSAEAQATVSRNPQTGKVAVDFEGLVRIIGVQAARTHISINERRLDATLEFDYLIISGKFRVFVGHSSAYDKTVFGGSGNARVGLKKGAVWKKDLWLTTVYLPPVDLSVNMYADFGTFTNGAIGFKGGMSMYGVDIGVYVDSNMTIDLLDVDEHQLITPDVLARAKNTWRAIQRGEVVSAAAIDSRFIFADDGTVAINVPIPSLEPEVSALDADRPVTFTLKSDVVFMLAQPTTGTLKLTLSTPDGTLVTPFDKPAGVTFIESVSDGTVQSTYFVDQAAAGVWQMHLAGDVDNSLYALAVVGNFPAPQLTSLAATTTATPNQILAQWRVLSTNPDTKVNLFATQDPITNTNTITDSQGGVTTTVTPNYAGLPVKLGMASATNGTLQNETVDLSGLPSGDYYFWIEADDQQNPSVPAYLMNGNTPAKITVDHPNDYPVSWSPILTPTIDVGDKVMLVQWQPHGHPDIDYYTLNYRSSDPVQPTKVITDAIVVSAQSSEPLLGAIVDGIEPNRGYIITICANDIEKSRTVCSPEQTISTPQPQYLIGVASDHYAVPAGQTIAATLQFTLSPDLPYPVGIQPTYELLPDGFTVLFDRDTVTSTSSSTVSVVIHADDEMLPGDYVVPLTTYSGNLKKNLVLFVTVTPFSSEAGTRVYLPVVAR